MQDIKAIIPAKDKWVSIVWQVNDWCNFRCTYCSEWNWAGRNRNDHDIPLIVDTLEKIIGFVFSNRFCSCQMTSFKTILPSSGRKSPELLEDSNLKIRPGC